MSAHRSWRRFTYTIWTSFSMRICVVGTGAAGLCAARHFTVPDCKHCQVQIIEKCSTLGGTWVYSPMTDSSSYSSCTSMYKNLVSNLPKEVMAFPDYPFRSNLPSYCGHKDVLQYLHNYANHFNLHKYIRYNTVVESIRPFLLTDSCSAEENCLSVQSTITDRVKWKVRSKDLFTGNQYLEDYDAVVVCKGNFSSPYIPDISGLSSFVGSVSHSFYYREPEKYKDQDVLVVGAGNSGRDLVLDLSSICNKVYICNRGLEIKSSLPSNVSEVPSIENILGNGVRFSNGREVKVDSVILATGYTMTFPFLNEECGVKVVLRGRLTPVFKHTFNSLYPSMAFVGVNFNFLPFPLYHYQCQWIKSVWCEQQQLPSREEMMEDEEETYQKRLAEGFSPEKAGHYLMGHQWELFDYLSKSACVDSLSPVVRSLFDYAITQREQNLMHYRKQNFIIDENKWRFR